MSPINQTTLQIIQIMDRDLHFQVNAKNVIKDTDSMSGDVHIRIDVEKEKFYNSFFMDNLRQIQLLNALEDPDEAVYLVENLKNDLSAIVEKATHTSKKIVFHIPLLEKCITANIQNY